MEVQNEKLKICRRGGWKYLFQVFLIPRINKYFITKNDFKIYKLILIELEDKVKIYLLA